MAKSKMKKIEQLEKALIEAHKYWHSVLQDPHATERYRETAMTNLDQLYTIGIWIREIWGWSQLHDETLKI